jgi:hypothetical protein
MDQVMATKERTLPVRDSVTAVIRRERLKALRSRSRVHYTTGPSMPNQTPGILWTYFQNAVLMTIPVSAVLLVWYKRSVSRNMRSTSEAAAADTPQLDSGAAPAGDTPLAESDSTDTASAEGSIDNTANELRSRRRVAVVYTIGSAVAAGILTVLFFASGVEVAAVRVFVVWYAFWWPVVPAVAALLAVSRRRAVLMFALYVIAGTVVTWVWSLFNKLALGRSAIVPSENVVSFLNFLLQEAWLPYLIILITTNRRVRSVSPLALAGLLVFSYSALAVYFATVALMDTGSVGRSLISLVGVHISSVLFLAATLPVGLVCWWGLRLLGRGYEQKSFSDVQLVVDSWWLIVVFNVIVLTASDLGWTALAGLLAWVAYRVVVEALLKAWRIAPYGNRAPRLLLLRVFGFQRRTEKLFDGVAQRWRFRGTATLIAGTDLVSRLIDPGDVVSFVGGQLRRQFVQSRSDLHEQLRLLDRVRDPDGRFRVNKFFCFDDTWRPTLQALVTRTDLVLMDVRGLSERNSGCQFELQQLADSALLAKTVFVVDESTDSRLLEASVGARANLVHAGRRSGTHIDSILRALHACEQPYT